MIVLIFPLFEKTMEENHYLGFVISSCLVPRILCIGIFYCARRREHVVAAAGSEINWLMSWSQPLIELDLLVALMYRPAALDSRSVENLSPLCPGVTSCLSSSLGTMKMSGFQSCIPP